MAVQDKLLRLAQFIGPEDEGKLSKVLRLIGNAQGRGLKVDVELSLCLKMSVDEEGGKGDLEEMRAVCIGSGLRWTGGDIAKGLSNRFSIP